VNTIVFIAINMLGVSPLKRYAIIASNFEYIYIIIVIKLYGFPLRKPDHGVLKNILSECISSSVFFFMGVPVLYIFLYNVLKNTWTICKLEKL
jgi:hypothetical protein